MGRGEKRPKGYRRRPPIPPLTPREALLAIDASRETSAADSAVPSASNDRSEINFAQRGQWEAMSTTDKYLKPWRVDTSSAVTGSYRIVAANNEHIAYVPRNLAPDFCAMGDAEAERDKLREELANTRQLLAEVTPPAEDWWCPTCKKCVHVSRVTDEDYHKECGTYLGAVNAHLWANRARAALAKARGEG